MPIGGRHLNALVKLAARSVLSRGDAPEAGPRRKITVESREPAVGDRRLRAYLAATDGAELLAFRAPDPPLPPAYGGVLEAAAVLELLAQRREPVPLGGIVHLESEIFLLRPLRAAVSRRHRFELDGIEQTPRGDRLTVASRVWGPSGQLARQGSSVFLLREAEHAAAARRHERAAEREGDDHSAWRRLAGWELGGGEGRRYARASGDFNPIHLWGWSARPFGFRRPILHGFCIQARVAHALAAELLGGDAEGLRRLRVVFRAPLLLPARVELWIRGPAEAAGDFRVSDAGTGRVYAEGSYAAG